MRFRFYPDEDSLYIDLSNRVAVESREVSADVTLDFDDNGRLVGIDIKNAGEHVDLFRLETVALPIVSLSMVRDEERDGRTEKREMEAAGRRMPL